MRRIQTIKYTAPSAWASYFINGDDSGLEPEEKTQADKWLAWVARVRAVHKLTRAQASALRAYYLNSAE
jgi:hypothetical protein